MKKIEEKKANQWFPATTIDPFEPISMVPMKVTRVVLLRSTTTHSSNDQERNAMQWQKVGRYFALGHYFAHWGEENLEGGEASPNGYFCDIPFRLRTLHLLAFFWSFCLVCLFLALLMMQRQKEGLWVNVVDELQWPMLNFRTKTTVPWRSRISSWCSCCSFACQEYGSDSGYHICWSTAVDWTLSSCPILFS